MATKPKAAKNDIIEPDVAEVSSDASNWSYRESKLDWPETDGPHVEQVYDGLTAAKD